MVVPVPLEWHQIGGGSLQEEPINAALLVEAESKGQGGKKERGRSENHPITYMLFMHILSHVRSYQC